MAFGVEAGFAAGFATACDGFRAGRAARFTAAVLAGRLTRLRLRALLVLRRLLALRDLPAWLARLLAAADLALLAVERLRARVERVVRRAFAARRARDAALGFRVLRGAAFLAEARRVLDLAIARRPFSGRRLTTCR
jgi:hypothetical protein